MSGVSGSPGWEVVVSSLLIDQQQRVEALRVLLREESGDGARLADDAADNPICAVTVNEAVPCIQVVWRRYATTIQLRFVHELVLLLQAQHGLAGILGDDTRLATVHQEDRRWIVEDWMPRATRAGLRTIAQTRAAQHFGQLAIEQIRSAAPTDIVFRYFDHPGDARRWLRTQASPDAGSEAG